MDRFDDLWVGTGIGLFLFEGADLTKEPKIYFPQSSITDLKEDFEGNYWMTTGNQGVYFIPDPRINTLHFKDEDTNNARMLTSESLLHKIYFGSYWGKILSVDKNFEIEVLYNPQKQFAKNLNHSYKKGNEAYFKSHTIRENEDGTSVQFEDSKFFSNLLNIPLRDTTSLNRYEKDRELQKIAQVIKSRIQCVEEDKNGALWVGTQSGMFKIEYNDQFKVVKDTSITSSTALRINDIRSDSNGNLWIASIGHGVMYKTPDTIYQIGKAEGLRSDLVNCIVIQDSSTLWLGTNQGLNRLSYHFTNNKIHITDIHDYGVLDGLPSNFINAIEYWNGFLWLVTNKGVAYIKPKSLKTEYPNIPIHLEHFMVNDVIRTPKSGLQLQAKENDIFLQMTGISYDKKNTNGFYRYRLSQSNQYSQWNYTNDRNIRFLDLSAGHYTFEAAAKNKSGEWSKTPIRLDFEIEPFFTQTAFFKFLMALLLITVLSILFIFRDTQLKRRNTLQQNLMKVKMKAKEYELVALRNQMNPHFVFNSLNAIQSYIFRNDPLKANYYLSKFSSLMRDSLEFSRLKYIGLKDEIRFLKTYLELEQMRFPEAFDYTIDIDPDIPIQQYSIPSLLFQPVLENIVKHAFKEIEYQGLIEIQINEHAPGQSLSVIIQDNGSGFQGNFFSKPRASTEYKSLGLTIVKNQIEALNMQSEQENASFSIANRADENSTEHGVRVSFVIPVKSLLSKISHVKISNTPIKIQS